MINKKIPVAFSLVDLNNSPVIDFENGVITLPDRLYSDIIKQNHTTEVYQEKVFILFGYLMDSRMSQEIKVKDFEGALEDANKKEADKILRTLNMFLKEDYIRIRVEYLKNNIVGVKNISEFIKANKRIFQRLDDYSPRIYSKGYRVSPEYRFEKDGCFIKYKLSNKYSIRRLNKVMDMIKGGFRKIPKRFSFMKDFKNQFYLDIPPNLKANISEDRKKYFYFSYGRAYHDLFNVKKELRKYLKVRGHDERLKILDIKNSQPLFFIKKLEEFDTKFISECEDFKEFKSIILDGVLYDKFAVGTSIDRKIVKQTFFDSILFFRGTRDFLRKKNVDDLNQDDINRLKVFEYFRNHYPVTHQFIKEFKYTVDPTNTLWMHLQIEESYFFLEKFCLSLKDKTKPFITIHDAIIFNESDQDIIVNNFNEQSKHYFGWQQSPSIEIKYLDEA